MRSEQWKFYQNTSHFKRREYSLEESSLRIRGNSSLILRIIWILTNYSQCGTVRAVDGDKGINNKLIYSITKGPKYLFDIDANSGTVSTRAQLDREAEENIDGTFILEITVKEISKIIPTPSVSTEVTIILTDINDETPTFRSSRYNGEINENAPQNTPIYFIGEAVPEVYDHDLVRIQYTIGYKYLSKTCCFPPFSGNQWHFSIISRRWRRYIRCHSTTWYKRSTFHYTR